MIVNADARFIPLADGSINCVITSPPYYGLRDYGTAKWEGGDPDCNHTISMPTKWNDPKRGYEVLRPEVANRGGDGTRCHLCGAIRIDQQIGLEQTPDEYIANLVDVFRECKRILRDDGTLWIVIGDSYSGSGNGSGDYREDGASISKNSSKYGTHKPGTPSGLKPKDLIGIPWMLAFALRADGWYLRQDIIWAKPNPMPESVKDRCTKSHEYIFLLSKSPKYYYDNEAVREPVSQVSLKRAEYGWNCDRPSTKNGSMGGEGIHTERMGSRFVNPSGRNKRDVWTAEADFFKMARNGTNIKGHSGYYNIDGELIGQTDRNGMPVRNKRDVWTVTTKPYKGAHYATFNPDLIKPCILAGAPEGGIVFDPFVGSGTTVATAVKLGRRGVGLDLSMKYLRENARERIYQEEMQPVLCTR